MLFLKQPSIPVWPFQIKLIYLVIWVLEEAIEQQ